MPSRLRDKEDFYAEWIKSGNKRKEMWSEKPPEAKRPRRKFWLVVVILIGLIAFRYWENPYGQQVKDGLNYALNSVWDFSPVTEKVAELTGAEKVAPALSYQENPGVEFPVNGQIIQKYGWQKSDWESLERFNSGIRIQAEAGATVKAIQAGIVTRMEENPELGAILQLKHEEGFYSLYGGIEFLTLAVGQNVPAGESIGKIKASEPSPALYLEIRKDNQLVDPLAVLEGAL